MAKLKAQSEFHIRQNTTFKLLDKDGKVQKLFQDGFANRLILSLFRDKLGIQPIGKDGQVKPGLLNHIAAYGIRINFLTGMWQDEISFANLVTSAGFAGISSRLNGSGSEAAFTYIELGIGTTAANASDTTLESAITDSGLARASATVSRTTTTVANDTARLTYTWTASGTKAVTESGVLNAASAGTLLNRQVFSAVNLVSGNSFQATHDFAFS